MLTRFALTSVFLMEIISGFSQSVLNGSFNSGSSNWGCSPEAYHVESVYGGSNTTNRVAEIDNAAGLCQSISGFTIGDTYILTFDCSRRTNCGPTLQSMNLTIDGNALSTSISRNGTSFSFVGESFSFTATATTHTITFSGTSGGTCGLILDNITVLNTLPAELTLFDITCLNENEQKISWQTASEKNVDYFEIQSTKDLVNYDFLGKVDAAGNSSSLLNYEWIYREGDKSSNIFYYRLKTVDFDGHSKKSHLISLDENCNGSDDLIVNIKSLETSIHLNLSEFGNIKIYDSSGKLFYVSNNKSANFVLPKNLFSTGIYYVLVESEITEKRDILKLPVFR
ncbi:MAG: DUF642 domain-containing protein [Crocinitomicaceae bacterium]|nr:DUF642 domain-containing protein [Crocinitomicaceae bacterium]